MIDLNQIYILDNFLPKVYQDSLEEKYTGGNNWYLSGTDTPTTFGLVPRDQNPIIDPNSKIWNTVYESYQFTESVYNRNNDPQFNYESIEPIYLLHYIDRFFQNSFKIIPYRIKVNLQTPSTNKNPTLHNSPHVDFNLSSDLYTLIYYVNDSDGDTIIFNERYKGSRIKEFTIDKKIKPKKGTVVMFPYDVLHCGSTPIKSNARIVINYNFHLIPL